MSFIASKDLWIFKDWNLKGFQVFQESKESISRKSRIHECENLKKFSKNNNLSKFRTAYRKYSRWKNYEYLLSNFSSSFQSLYIKRRKLWLFTQPQSAFVIDLSPDIYVWMGPETIVNTETVNNEKIMKFYWNSALIRPMLLVWAIFSN